MSTNLVILQGNLGQDPEVRYMPNGNAACNFSMATSNKWKDKSTGQQQERTEWHRVVVFGKLAEVVGQYLKKGDKALIQGEIRYGKFTNQEGIEVNKTEILANNIDFINTSGSGQGGQQQQQPARQPSQQQQQPAPAAGFDDFDDDISF